MHNQRRVNFNFGRQLDRRTMLRGLGVSLGLPWLSAMNRAIANNATDASPQRFVAISLGLGLHSDNLVPSEAGRDYQPSLYLKGLQDIRDRFTVISGTSHPGVGGGHRAEASILTGSPMGSSGRARNTISVDQYMAKHLGDATRYPSLVLGANGSNSPCYTENGAMIPAESSPSSLFAKLFIDKSKQERELQASRVLQGRSIMDLVGDDARSLQRELGVGDRDRLDAYFTSVRDLEKRMSELQRWANLPKPKVAGGPPQDVGSPNDLIARQKTMCDVIKLALQTDSSRFVSFHLGGSGGVLPIDGVDEGYHTLSHHGLDDEKLAQLALVETAIINEWGTFLRQLKESQDGQGDLLSHTSVLLTSNLGNASNHDNRNMPVLFAGGQFKHGQHLAFNRQKNYPLPNLFVSVLQQVGMEVDEFATSTGTMTGLV
ncbi:MAG: DUF1552 domain-containing protein [Pirellulaceae bacterium]|nr:DUF1552 domain-containing protein [Pirellulaceae bacterium]